MTDRESDPLVAAGASALASSEAARRLASLLRFSADKYRQRAAELTGRMLLLEEEDLEAAWEAGVVGHAAVIADRLAEECDRGADRMRAAADRMADRIAGGEGEGA